MISDKLEEKLTTILNQTFSPDPRERHAAADEFIRVCKAAGIGPGGFQVTASERLIQLLDGMTSDIQRLKKNSDDAYEEKVKLAREVAVLRGKIEEAKKALR